MENGIVCRDRTNLSRLLWQIIRYLQNDFKGTVLVIIQASILDSSILSRLSGLGRTIVSIARNPKPEALKRVVRVSYRRQSDPPLRSKG